MLLLDELYRGLISIRIPSIHTRKCILGSFLRWVANLSCIPFYSYSYLVIFF